MYMIAPVWCICRNEELADHPFQAALFLLAFDTDQFWLCASPHPSDF